jgi:hypothetical protein
VVIVKNSADINFMVSEPDADYLAMAAFRTIANSISNKE